MATHSSILALKIPWTEEPWSHKELASVGSLHYVPLHRVAYLLSYCFLFFFFFFFNAFVASFS